MRINMTRCNALVVSAILGALATLSGCGMPPVTYVKPQPATRVTPINADVILHLPSSSRSRTLTGSNSTGVITSYAIPTGELLAELIPDVARDAFRSIEVVESEQLPSASTLVVSAAPLSFSPEEGPSRWAWSTVSSSAALRWRVHGPWGDVVFDTVVTGRAEGTRGPAGGKKQTARRTGLALQDLYTQSVNALTASRTINGFASWLPLTLAAMRGDSLVVDSLLAAGVPADVLDPAGRTPLMAAAARGHVSIAERLLQRGAELSRRDRNGRSATMYASEQAAVAAVLQRRELEQLRASEEQEWAAATTANTDEAYDQFVRRYRESRYATEAWHRLGTLREQRTPGLARQLQDVIAKAPALPAVPPDAAAFASNMIIQRTQSGVTYYASIPSSPAAVPVDGTTFLIKQVRIPKGPEGVVAHCGDRSFPVSWLTDAGGTHTMIIPREVLPCRLELRGVLGTHVPVSR